MGVKDWIFGKLEKKIEEEFHDENENIIKTDEVEKASYSDYSYKNVKRIRERGRLWGIDVPYLQHPVKKQEKPRPIFLSLGIISAILLAIVACGCVFFTIKVILPLIAQVLPMGELFNVQPWDIFGLFAIFTSAVPILMWIIIIVLIAMVVGVMAIFIVITKQMFSFSKISMQEVAKGYQVRKLISSFGVILAVIIIGGIVLLVNCAPNMTAKNIAIVVSVLVAFVAVIGTVFGLLVAQKVKENKEFEKLPIENQEDFINHNRALERANRRTNKNKSIISSSKVDF